MYTRRIVYTIDMLKNITFSVEEEVIAKAREAAKNENTTLNELVREWIEQYAGREKRRESIQKFFQAFEGVDLGPKMTREEMNERR